MYPYRQRTWNSMNFKRTFICFILFAILSDTCLVSAGTRCESNKKKFVISRIDQTVMTCPPLFGDKDDSFCCTRADGTPYCCDASEFLEETGIGFVVPVLVSVIVAMLIICCVCCICCPCCIWYKRRNRGTVYNNVPPVSLMQQQPAVPQHGPHSDVYQQQPPPYPVMPMPQPMHHGGMPQPMHHGGMPQPVHHGEVYPPVPPHGIPMAQQYPPSVYPPAVPPHGQQPPSYNEAATNQMYSRQSPYNPNF